MKKTKLFAVITAAVMSVAVFAGCGEEDVLAIPKDGTYKPTGGMAIFKTNDKSKIVLKGNKADMPDLFWEGYGHYYGTLADWDSVVKRESGKTWYWEAPIKTEFYDVYLDEYVEKTLGGVRPVGLASRNGKQLLFLGVVYTHK